MYGRLFASMWTGSMVGAGPVIFSVWAYALSTSDKEGFCELNHKYLAYVIGCKEEDIAKAIDYLCQNDPNSRSPEEDGKRLIKIGKFGYAIVNYQKYIALYNEERRREYLRIAKQQSRERLGSQSKNVNSSQQESKNVNSVYTVTVKDVVKEEESRGETNNHKILNEIINAIGGEKTPAIGYNVHSCLAILDSMVPPLTLLELDPILKWLQNECKVWLARELKYRPKLETVLSKKLWLAVSPSVGSYLPPGQDPKHRRCSCGLPADFVEGDYDNPYCRWCGPKTWAKRFPGQEPGERPK